MVAARKLKLRTCKAQGCDAEFSPFNSMQKVCSVECARDFALAKAIAKDKSEKAKAKRQRIARKREFRENDPKYVAKQAKAFLHRWVVAVRDVGKPCVSSGRTTSAKWNAGHYLPSGNNSALRYDPANIHKQSSEDNQHRSGNLIPYRIELLKRIGESEVERLESNRAVKRWTIEELRVIRDKYRDLLREAGEVANCYALSFHTNKEGRL